MSFCSFVSSICDPCNKKCQSWLSRFVVKVWSNRVRLFIFDNLSRHAICIIFYKWVFQTLTIAPGGFIHALQSIAGFRQHFPIIAAFGHWNDLLRFFFQKPLYLFWKHFKIQLNWFYICGILRYLYVISVHVGLNYFYHICSGCVRSTRILTEKTKRENSVSVCFFFSVKVKHIRSFPW